MKKKVQFQSLALFFLISGAVSNPGWSADAYPPLDLQHEFECPLSMRQKSGFPRPDCSALFPIHKGDSSEMALLINGESSLTARLKTLRSAKKSIRIQALIFTGDESGLFISEILKEKKIKEHVDVKIIVDGLSNPSPQTQTMYFDLKQHGIEVEGYETAYLQWVNEISFTDPLLPDKRFHEKMWVIDGEEPSGVAIVGGLNIANEYFRVADKAKNRWRDQDMIVRGPIVADVTRAFDRNFGTLKELKNSHPDIFNTDFYWRHWNRGIKGLYENLLSGLADAFGRPKIPFIQNKELVEQVEDADHRDFSPVYQPATLRFVQNRPRLQETYIYQVYRDLFKTAKEEILIANAYVLPSDELLDELVNAVRRGVHVKLLTNSKDTNDVPFMSDGIRALYWDLMQANAMGPGLIEIFEWQGNWFGEGTLHAKFAVIDRKISVIGSYNLDQRSESLNSETAMVWENESFAKILAAQFLGDDLSKSRKIGLEDAARYKDTKRLDTIVSRMLSDSFKGQL